jgi:hypothetical protein
MRNDNVRGLSAAIADAIVALTLGRLDNHTV